MLQRKATEAFARWKENHSGQAMLVTGARQVGKTYLIEQFARENYKHVVKLDLVDQTDVLKALNAARSSQELFMALSAFTGAEMFSGETVIFIDEVQQCDEALTLIKYLVQRGEFDYILSGSLLGVELDDIRSAPVGYLHVVDMYPLDFQEFCWANRMGADAWDEAEAAFIGRRPVFGALHERLMSLFHWYLVVGGMPRTVAEFVNTQNIALVQELQKDILRLYRFDISKYAKKSERRQIKEIFDQIPSQLDTQSKRFNFSSIAPKGTYERYQDSFLWLVDAGVTLAVRNVKEPKRPLKLAENRSFFKLFMNDVGLLSAACGVGTARSILADETSMNYGSIYENAVAQELHTRGKGVWFFRNRKAGEIDFVIELDGRAVPVEVKSGKTYKRHSALTNVLATVNYGIDEAIVLCGDNVSVEGSIVYCPVYMVAFLK